MNLTRAACVPALAGVILMSTTAAAFDLQGHRGARGHVPENSLPGFERALAIGVTTLELDTAITRDGVVIISHDPRVNPDITRDGSGHWFEPPYPPFASLDYGSIKAFDVGRIRPGSSYAQRFPFQKPRDKTRIPRLSDLFALTAKLGAGAVRFNIETKVFPEEPHLTVDPETFARKVVAEIRAANVAARATIQSFDWRTLMVVQRDAPDIATVHLTARQPWMDNIQADRADASPWTAGIRFADAGSVPKMVKLAGGRIWSPHHADIDVAAVREAKALGLAVIPWTPNTRPEMERMLGMGVDGLITDYPDVLRGILVERGIAVPAVVKRARPAARPKAPG